MPTDTEPRIGVDPIIEEALPRWKRADEASDAQRRRTLAAKQFRAGNQWDPAIRTAREGKQALQGVAAQPPRPCLTVDRLSQPCRQISNQIKTANFAITVRPNGHGADTATAEIYAGYLRRVQNQARSEAPIEWAADGAIEGGFGWFRLRCEYVDQAPDDASPELFYQEPCLERIPNNLSVYDDPMAVKPTRSDSRYRFITEDIEKDDLLDRWPVDIYGEPVDVRSLEEFAGTGDPIAKDWVGKDTVRIAEYWRVTHTTEKWAALPDGSIQRVEEFPENAITTRTVRRPKVEGFKISACHVLEKWDWLGTRIPQVPVLAEELNVDGETILRGVIEEGMDAQRMVNFMYSGAVENYALMPKTPLLIATGAIGAYKQIYETLNIYNWSYAPFDAYDESGRQMPDPKLMPRDPSSVEAAARMMQVSEEAIKATTGWYDSGLGAHDRRTLSGRAKQSEIQQSELGSSNYGDAVRRALIYAGELIVELLPKITQPGQILHILGLDDDPKQVIVKQPFTQGKDGRAQPIPESELANLKEGEAQFFDPSKGRYAITVDVGKASATKREEGAGAIGELLSSPSLPPDMAAVLAPEYVRQLSFAGAQTAAAKMEKTLPPQLRGDEGDGDPEKLALQQQVQQLQQALQGKQAEEQAKQQAALQKTQIEESAESQRAQQDGQMQLMKAEIAANAQIAVAEIKAGLDAKEGDLDRRLKLIEIYLTSKQEARLDREAQIHEHVQGAHDRAHDVGLTAMEQAHERQMAQIGHAQALEQSEQAAALKPTPNGEGE